MSTNDLVWIMGLPAWVIVLITAAARLHVMRRDQWLVVDHLHRLGLVGVATVAGIAIFLPFTDDAPTTLAPWRDALLTSVAWSMSFIWVTKRDTIPWWDSILGIHRKHEGWKDLPWHKRLRAELDVLWNGFKPSRHREMMAGPKGKLP